MAVFPLVMQRLDIALVLIPRSAIRRAAVMVSNHVPVLLIIWHLDVCSRKAIDAPIVLDNDKSDTELDTQPPTANNHHASISAVPTLEPKRASGPL